MKQIGAGQIRRGELAKLRIIRFENTHFFPENQDRRRDFFAHNFSAGIDLLPAAVQGTKARNSDNNY